MLAKKIINRDELYNLFAPFVIKKYRNYNFSVLMRIQKARVSCLFDRLKNSSINRSTDIVKKQYDESWKKNETINRKECLVKWKDEYFEIDMSGISCIHLSCIKQIVDFLNPVDIFEVGFGRGGKLLPLAAVYPDKRIGGIELSNSGFNEVLKIIQNKNFSDELKKNIPFHLKDYSNLKSINLFNGSAEKLPVGDKSYEFIYTSQALEQMEAIRDRVMLEIVRITKKYVLMIEPFRDWNSTGMHRNRVVSRNYFEAKIDDLAKYGLKPIYINRNIPSKIYMNVGIVLAEVL